MNRVPVIKASLFNVLFSLSSQPFLFISSDFAAILALLQQVKGPVNVRKYFIQHAMTEAAR